MTFPGSRIAGSGAKAGSETAAAVSATGASSTTLEAIRHPSAVRRTIWLTATDPSTLGVGPRVTISLTLVTFGSGPDSSIVAFSVRCCVSGGSAAHSALTASRISARPVAAPVTPVIVPSSVNSSA